MRKAPGKASVRNRRRRMQRERSRLNLLSAARCEQPAEVKVRFVTPEEARRIVRGT